MFDRTNSPPRLSFYEIERRAGHERSLILAAYLRNTATAIAALFQDFARACIRLARRFAAERRMRDDVRMFQRFDDRMLADIGLGRGEIEYAVRFGRSRSRPAVAPHPWRRPRSAAMVARAGTGFEQRIAAAGLPKR